MMPPTLTLAADAGSGKEKFTPLSEPLLSLDLACRTGSASTHLRRSQLCADCDDAGPQFVETERQILLCSACRRYHIELGTACSKIVSLKDSPAIMSTLDDDCNDKANSQWESCRPSYFPRPHPSDKSDYRRQFIFAKYGRLEFCSPSMVSEINGAGKRKARSTSTSSLRDQPAYLDDEMNLQLFRYHEGTWQLFQVYVSCKTGVLSCFRSDWDKSDQGMDTFSLRSVNAEVMDTSRLDGDGASTVLMLTSPELSNAWVRPQRAVFLRDTKANNQRLVELFVFIRRAKGLVLGTPDSQEITHRVPHMGWLWKRGHQVPFAWKKRWFVLDENVLYYYDRPMDPISSAEISLGPSSDGFSIVPGDVRGDRTPNSFVLVTPRREYHLHTEQSLSGESALKDWFRVLNNSFKPAKDKRLSSQDADSDSEEIPSTWRLI